MIKHVPDQFIPLCVRGMFCRCTLKKDLTGRRGGKLLARGEGIE